jgi:hypothetical protein
MDDLQDVPAKVLHKEEQTPHLKTSSGGTRTCPHQHET